MRRALVFVAVLVALGLAACASLRPVVRRAMTPGVPFDPSAAPPAPDYDDPAAWSALPEREDAGDAVPAGLPAVAQTEAPVDVFYVHPTTHVGKAWNARWDDPQLVADTDAVATGIQAPAFNGCCAVYAPRYRQSNGTAFTRPSPDGDGAIRVAASDVKRAFAAFQARRGAERPYVLAGHSQGSVLAWMLLEDVIVGSPAEETLVVAYLPGAGIPAEGLPGVPPCTTPDAIGCVASWNAREPGYVDRGFEVLRPTDGPRLCTNPVTWTERPASVGSSRGAVFLEDRDTAPRPGFASARCEGGTLVVDAVGRVRRTLPSRILDAVIGPGNLHPMEYQLWFMDLRHDVDVRISAFPTR